MPRLAYVVTEEVTVPHWLICNNLLWLCFTVQRQEDNHGCRVIDSGLSSGKNEVDYGFGFKA